MLRNGFSMVGPTILFAFQDLLSQFLDSFPRQFGSWADIQ